MHIYSAKELIKMPLPAMYKALQKQELWAINQLAPKLKELLETQWHITGWLDDLQFSHHDNGLMVWSYMGDWGEVYFKTDGQQLWEIE